MRQILDRWLPEELEAVGRDVLDVAFEVHSALGPGALESVYARCLRIGLEMRGRRVDAERWVDLSYQGVTIERALRMDLLVDDLVVIEVKAVEAVAPVHLAQLVSYLKLARKPLGYLLNFHVERFRDGFHRRINTRVL